MPHSFRFRRQRAERRNAGQWSKAGKHLAADFSLFRRLRFEPLEDRRLLAAVIGMDFGFFEDMTANQTAGVVPQQNWNNIATGGTGKVNDLVDHTGTPTTIDVNWTSNNTFRVSGDTPADGNATIYKGYLDTTDVSVTTVLVAQIPFAFYDVYVYFDGDTSSGRSGTYTIDTSTLNAVTQGPYLDFANWPIATGGNHFVLADAPNEPGNYAVFRNLRGASFVLTAAPVDFRAPLNAIQIVEQPQALVVDTTADIVDGNYGAGQFSLREAIDLANTRPGDDTIAFAPAMSGQMILLGGSQLTITDAVTIDAAPLTQNLTIHAQQQSRIFNIMAGSGAVTLVGLTLTGGRTTAENEGGGAIRSSSSGLLTLIESTVGGNRTTGDHANGGGIFALGALTLIESTVSGNSTTENEAGGGGIWVSGHLMLTQSTISGNSSAGDNSSGGGIYSFGGGVTLNQSTVSGNSTAGLGANGGGVFQRNTFTNHSFSISGSIVAGNTAGGGSADLVPDPESTLTVTYSLIGDNANTGLTETQTPDVNGNMVGSAAGAGIINPMLDVLADNGGPTLTRALLAGSPAIDAGNPTIVFDPAVFDQRGTPYLRVSGSRIDMGAIESPVDILIGDYNKNSVVDAADYVLWRKTLGTTGVPPFSGADGDGDVDITTNDYDVWTANFGESLTPPGSGNGSAFTAAIDEAMTVGEQATTYELTVQNTNTFDEELVPMNDVALLFNSAATSNARVARFKMPTVARPIPIHAARTNLLIAVSLADNTTPNKLTNSLLEARERTFAADHDAALHLASDAWFTALGWSP